MQPPWIAFPDIARASIGWRTGDGADHIDDFYRMFTRLSDADKATYEALHPEPHEWLGLYRDIRDRPWR